MNILFKKLLLLFCLCCSFHYTLKAQIDIEKISGIETEKFEGIIDSLHHTYEYFNYPSLRLYAWNKIQKISKFH